MKILQINVRYNYGSTGKMTKEIHQALLDSGDQSVVLYGRKDNFEDENVHKVCTEFYAKLNNLRSRFDGLMYGGCYFSTNRIISMIKKEKPDIVHLQCINGYFVNIYRLVNWLKNNKIKTVLTLHAEFMYTANCAHALDCSKWVNGCKNCERFKKETKSLFFDRTEKSFEKMKNAFEGFEDNLTVVSVSPWLHSRAVQSEILKDKKHTVICNGVDTDIFKFRHSESIKKELGIKDEKIVFHATAMFSDEAGHFKGGRYIIELAERMKNKPVKFVIAGKNNVSSQLPDNIIVLGEINDQNKLAEYYSAADVTVITSKKETFSMICAESLCCGTPVAGFKAGAPELISMTDYSEFAEYGDVDSLENIVNVWTQKDCDKFCVSFAAEKIYSCKKMIDSYKKVYQEMIYED